MTIKPLRWSIAPDGPAARPDRRSFKLIKPSSADFVTDRAVWDSWPALTSDGGVWTGEDGRERWFALAAPRRADPDARHGEARIWLFALHGQRLEPLGPVFPDAFTPGSREWSGGASIEGDEIVLRFTAAGHRGEGAPSAAQRLFESRAPLAGHGLSGWSPPSEMFAADGSIYRKVDGGPLIPGKVKGFRDPDLFVDDDGRQWLLFTGSSAASDDEVDGVIGLARKEGGEWRACPPPVDASGVNRELERPHVRRFGDRLYLFWSTHGGAFADDWVCWPMGLYGAVADRVEGPWRPVNGDGLIAANRAESPYQAYGWLVLPDGRVTGFVDRPGDGSRFCGGWAPTEKLLICGDKVVLR